MSEKIGYKEKKVDIQYFTDSDGFVVHVGNVLQWVEPLQTPENEKNYYILVALPDLGNMLVVRQIIDFDWNEQDGYKVIDLPGAVPFEVEPWKMGAI